MSRAKVKKQTTQKVDLRTLSRIKRIKRHLANQGVKLRQSDIIEEAFRYIMEDEWSFLEYVLSRYAPEKEEKTKKIVSDVISKPWFPY